MEQNSKSVRKSRMYQRKINCHITVRDLQLIRSMTEYKMEDGMPNETSRVTNSTGVYWGKARRAHTSQSCFFLGVE
jgi:hypothetical protein